MTNLRVVNTHAHLIDCEVWPKKIRFGTEANCHTDKEINISCVRSPLCCMLACGAVGLVKCEELFGVVKCEVIMKES